MANFCTNCGAPNDEGTKFCANCGTAMPEPAPAEQPVQEPVYAQQPVQQEGYYPQPQDYQQNPYAPAPEKKSSKKPIIIAVSVVLVIGIVFGILAICGVFSSGGSSIVGKWELDSKAVDSLGVSASLEFTNDGKCITGISGFDIEGTYTLDGDKLTMTYTFFGITNSEEYTYSISGDTLTLSNGTLQSTYNRK